VSLEVQALPSSHEFVLFVNTQPKTGLQVSVVQTLLSLQTTGVPPHTPPAQLSLVVQALLSLHVVPFPAFGFVHTPVPVLQVPATWHVSSAVHTTGFDPVQTPDWQVSVWVQALLSLQAVPLGFWPLVEQTPVETLQVAAKLHWSPAAQTTGFDPTQTLFWHVSLCVQALPSLHAVPFAAPWQPSEKQTVTSLTVGVTFWAVRPAWILYSK
jgi:hypothetical protein